MLTSTIVGFYGKDFALSALLSRRLLLSTTIAKLKEGYAIHRITLFIILVASLILLFCMNLSREQLVSLLMSAEALSDVRNNDLYECDAREPESQGCFRLIVSVLSMSYGSSFIAMALFVWYLRSAANTYFVCVAEQLHSLSTDRVDLTYASPQLKTSITRFLQAERGLRPSAAYRITRTFGLILVAAWALSMLESVWEHGWLAAAGLSQVHQQAALAFSLTVIIVACVSFP
eukprot:m.97524 g.97524  ORF g.97524 m.97524 type:complete len:232 (-) comp15533_c1_seq3:348-1043(-)